MGQFFCRRDAHGRDRWWLDVTGMGNRQRLVPATDEMMAELSRYRRAHRLPALPVDGEATPLVLPVGHAQRPLTRAALHLIVKTVSGRRPTGCARKATRARNRRACSNRRPRTGCATARARTWPTAGSTCASCATTSAMCR